MKKLLITFLLILLSSCDYSPIYSTEDSKFKINEIKTTGNKKLNKIFIKKISKFKNNSSNIIYDLEVESSKIVRSISKDERGKTKILEMLKKLAKLYIVFSFTFIFFILIISTFIELYN